MPSHPRIHRRSWIHRPALVALALVACESQATPDYKGESLMSIRGSIEIEDSQVDGTIVPAFAFLTGSDVHIVDVDVQGEFPADFVLDVYSPPPTEADSTNAELGGETGVSLGYITAVIEEHPMQEHYSLGPSGSWGCNTEVCSGYKKWCTPDQSHCYRERWTCPPGVESSDAVEDEDQCTLDSSKGDVALKGTLWASFAGLSQDYMIAYLRHDLEKDSIAARRLGASKTGLAKGYHLLELRAPTEADFAAADECEETARELAFTRYNAAHGTDLAYEDHLSLLCDEGEEVPGCDRALFYELLRKLQETAAELDCLYPGINLKPIAKPNDRRISVLIGQALQPIGRF